jgi:CxxC motif-containing protein (DUF1111 family)
MASGTRLGVTCAAYALGLALSGTASAQATLDPGPRPGPAGAGGPLAGLTAPLQAYFSAALPLFTERVSVSGKIPGSPGIGLGPAFNLDGCAGCHAFPAVGGTSGTTNPEIALANAVGATNTIPSFLSLNGPTRVARFVKNADGTADGSVHDLFTIAGRSDAPGCTLAQPDFATAVANSNVVFRVPISLFGDGLVEATPDANLIATQAAHAAEQASLGINAKFNHDAVDGTITRFGWKAEEKSLLAFAGDAELVEEGVTTDLRPNERDTQANCAFNILPEDGQPTTPRAGDASAASSMSAAAVNQAAFMRLTAPPTPAPATAASTAGRAVFASIGCDACHFPTQTTGPSAITNGQAVSYSPFSDFALHDMGVKLMDGVMQGQATGYEWRTAPLWGLGQRNFFLHDGRATTLDQAIAAHSSGPSAEADQVIANYNALPIAQRVQLMAFLRSL